MIPAANMGGGEGSRTTPRGRLGRSRNDPTEYVTVAAEHLERVVDTNLADASTLRAGHGIGRLGRNEFPQPGKTLRSDNERSDRHIVKDRRMFFILIPDDLEEFAIRPNEVATTHIGKER
jgi:hypothetical protein